jgi:hypothetical protein
MLPSRLLTVFAAAGLLASVGCSDTTAPNVPPQSTPGIPLEPQVISISGSIHVTGLGLSQVVLTTIDGLEIPLAGYRTLMLARVNDAGVEVRGFWNTDGAFEVTEFVVEIVNGAPVLDGVLIAVYDTEIYTETSTILGYALQLTRGDTVELKEPPAELLAFVGDRVWVAGPIDGPPTAFGVISE